MTRRLLTPHARRVLGFVGLPVAALAAAVALPDATLVLINESPSLPRGAWIPDPTARIEVGAVVSFAPPERARPYLARLGAPPDMPLLKRVAAVAGDRVCAREARLSVGDRTVRPLARDRRGSALAAWQGCRRLAPGELFVLGDGPASYDGRYFGPIREAAVTGIWRPLLVSGAGEAR